MQSDNFRVSNRKKRNKSTLNGLKNQEYFSPLNTKDIRKIVVDLQGRKVYNYNDTFLLFFVYVAKIKRGSYVGFRKGIGNGIE